MAHTKKTWEIDPALIDEEFIKLPGELARYSQLHVEASQDAEQADFNLEIIEASISLTIRDHAKNLGEKVTVDYVQAKMRVDPKWQAARRDAIEARTQEAAAKAMVNAVLAKRDMLISYGAHLRAQWGGDPSTRLPPGRARVTRQSTNPEDYDWSPGLPAPKALRKPDDHE